MPTYLQNITLRVDFTDALLFWNYILILVLLHFICYVSSLNSYFIHFFPTMFNPMLARAECG